jgi:quercetin dioxygenase-like cupin family protein
MEIRTMPFVSKLRKEATTMTKRTVRLALGALFFCGAVGAIALRIAWATPPIGVVNTLISGPASLDPFHLWSRSPEHLFRIQAEGQSDVYVNDIKIAPGGETGWHAHPGPAFVSVKSGVAIEYHGDDDCTRVVHLAGTAFMETSGHVHNVRNEGNEPLVLVILCRVPAVSARRIDMPNPGTCPF